MLAREPSSDASIASICAWTRFTSGVIRREGHRQLRELGLQIGQRSSATSFSDGSSSTSGKRAGAGSTTAISYFDCFAIRSACAADSSFCRSAERGLLPSTPFFSPGEHQSGRARVGLQLLFLLLELDLQVLRAAW